MKLPKIFLTNEKNIELKINELLQGQTKPFKQKDCFEGAETLFPNFVAYLEREIASDPAFGGGGEILNNLSVIRDDTKNHCNGVIWYFLRTDDHGGTSQLIASVREYTQRVNGSILEFGYETHVYIKSYEKSYALRYREGLLDTRNNTRCEASFKHDEEGIPFP